MHTKQQIRCPNDVSPFCNWNGNIRYRAFLSNYEISFKLRLLTADSIVLSHLAYGQEIINLTTTELKSFETVLTRALRTVLNQPHDTNATALRMISGHKSIKYIRLNSRIQNFLRIKNMPNDRVMHQLLNAEEWKTDTYTFESYQSDLQYLRRAQTNSSINTRTFENCIQNYSKTKSKRIIKRILNEADSADNLDQIRHSHCSALLEFFTPSRNHPLLRKSGKDYSTYISWMIASTDIYEDRQNQPRFEGLSQRCSLCKDEGKRESRQHLLTECIKTIHLITEYSENLQRISKNKYTEFSALPPNKIWKWILGGTIKGPVKNAEAYDSRPIPNPFKAGESVFVFWDSL